MPFAAAASTAPHAARAAADAARRSAPTSVATPSWSSPSTPPTWPPTPPTSPAPCTRTSAGRPWSASSAKASWPGRSEIEGHPAVAVWAGAWDGRLSIDAFHLDLEDTPDGPTLFGWPDAMFEADAKDSLLFCFGDPYTFPAVELFLPRVNEDYPGLPVAGGMASSPTGPGTPSLILNDEVKMQGAVGVLLRGPARFKTVVSQGCRPVGRPLVITKGQDNLINEIGGQTPLDYLRGLLEEVPPGDKDLMQRGLLIGLAITEYRDEFRPRRLPDPQPDRPRPADRGPGRHGPDSPRADGPVPGPRRAGPPTRTCGTCWRRRRRDGFKPAGGLTFSCNGRGTRMFPEPGPRREGGSGVAGPLALAGFFAAGELGPVGGTNFIHGFTASTVLFE